MFSRLHTIIERRRRDGKGHRVFRRYGREQVQNGDFVEEKLEELP